MLKNYHLPFVLGGLFAPSLGSVPLALLFIAANLPAFCAWLAVHWHPFQIIVGWPGREWKGSLVLLAGYPSTTPRFYLVMFPAMSCASPYLLPELFSGFTFLFEMRSHGLISVESTFRT